MRHYPIDDWHVVASIMALIFGLWACMVINPVAIIPVIAVLGEIWRG